MRSTPSRFTTFVTPTELDFEGAPTRAPHDARPLRGARLDLDLDHSRDASVLERYYPAVMRTISLLWGHPELNRYFAKIWSGQDPALTLEPDAMSEAMLLSGIHQRICPYGPARSVEDLYGTRLNDPWKIAGPRR